MSSSSCMGLSLSFCPSLPRAPSLSLSLLARSLSPSLSLSLALSLSLPLFFLSAGHRGSSGDPQAIGPPRPPHCASARLALGSTLTAATYYMVGSGFSCSKPHPLHYTPTASRPHHRAPMATTHPCVSRTNLGLALSLSLALSFPRQGYGAGALPPTPRARAPPTFAEDNGFHATCLKKKLHPSATGCKKHPMRQK